MKKFSSPTQKTGQLGEIIACKYLIRKGFTLVERNFTRKWGEIDIIARKDGVTHFIEVKSVSCENSRFYPKPEDQVHTLKRSRLKRVISTYDALYKVGEWQFDIACIFMNHTEKNVRIKFMEDIILV